MWQRCVGRATRWIRSRNSCCSPIPCWRVSEDAQAASQFRSWVVWSSRLEGGCVLRGCQSCSNSRDLQSAAEKSSFLYSAFKNEKTVQDICSPTVNALQTAAWERLMMVFDILAWFPNAQYTKTKMQMLLAVSHTTYKTFLLASLANL